ncbi:GtrA family protein [Actinoplanes solisilvae]|uniref:GtrA family protein n=1 Tax=Actinoplanes solisilvae TaxID=2486853 RepID=UPI001F0C516D|nr:GtrA family protein [Actinoplanes solisilvae]
MPEISPTRQSLLRTRLRALLRELSKFGTVGGIAFAIDTVIFNVLLQAGFETLIAKIVSTVIATTFAFVGNRYWTWRHRAHANMARQYTMFFVLNAIGLGIGLACLTISHYGLGQLDPAFQTQLADNISGQLVGTAAGSLFRFWSYRRFVFPAAAPPGAPSRQASRTTDVTSTPSPRS